MARVLKYTTTTPSGSIRKGNIALSTGNADYGTSFYTGIEPPTGGYVVYQNKATGGPSIKVAADDTELINITREISGGTYGSVQECLNYYFTQSDIIVVSSNSSPGNIASDGLILDLNVNNLPTNVQNLNNASSKLRNWYDNTGKLTYPVSGAVNIGLPLTSWVTRRSDIALITDGSVLPPNSGSAVWSSTVNTASYVNTLHRMWALGNQHGVIGSLGQGYYRYYMWVKGAPHNSPTASIQIDISDGNGGYANSGTPTIVGTGSAWQLLSAWDLGGSYNADKFFDYQLFGYTSGDTYYISGITVARYNVPDSSSLVPLISFPGYIDYYSTSSVPQQGYLFNGITSNSQSLVFDGADDYVQTSKTDFTANNDFTYELVIKSDQYLTSRGILANKGYWSSGGQGAAIGNISNPQTIYGYVTTNTGHYDINSTVGPTYGWTHVIMRRSNNDLRFFINGNQKGAINTISGTVTDVSNEFYLGSHNNGSNSPWKGNMALARVYNRALSDNEILQNFAASGYPRLVEDAAGTTDSDFSIYTGRVVNTLTSQNLYSSSSLVLTAAGYGTGSLYALNPVMTGVTSSRASTSTRLTNGGSLLEITTNVPNISYPYTDDKPYYLIEPQSTNLLTYSNNPFDNSNNWGNRQIENVTTTLYDTIGDVNILKLTEDTNNGQHRISSGNNYSSAYTGTKIWTSSFYAKPNGRSRIVIYVDNQIGGYIDLEAGTTTLTPAGYFKKSKVTKLANGYCYVEITFSKTNATSGYAPYYIEWLADSNNNPSYQGDGTSGILMYGYQIEEMQFGTSYIKTNAGSTVTRTASSRGTHLTGLQSKGILSSTGTVYIEGFYKGTSYYYQYVFGQTGVGGANGVSISTNQTTPSSTYSFSMRIYKSSSFVGDITLDSSYYDGKPFKMCFKYDGTNCHFFYNGVYKGYLQFSGASIDSFFTGTENTNNTTGNGSCLGISSMSMFPTALPDDQCLTLTR